DNDLVGRRVGRDDRPASALVLAGHDQYVVTLFDLHLEHLRRQRDNPHEALFPQLTANRAEDASTSRIPAVPDQDSGVLVEADVGPVCAAALLAGTSHDRLDDVALLDASPGQRVLDGRHDDVTDARVSPAAAAEHADAEDLLGTRVVGDLKPRLLLDHVNSCYRSPGIGARRFSVTWPSRGSRLPASAWSRTAAGSPSAARGRPRRRRSRRRAPCTSWYGAEPCRTWGA